MCDVVNDNGAVGVAVVHGCERLVAFLACSVPDLELDGCGFVESDGLSEESGADGGFAVVVELVLCKASANAPEHVLRRGASYLYEPQY